MKNLKRVLSMGLASVMLLGMMVMGVSATETKEFTDASEIQKTEAVTTMAALNVINGKDNGSFDPKGNVTRGEMAKMITIMLNGGQEPVLATGSTPKFSDTANHWARKYIEYCAAEQQGVIAGRGDGTFAPDAPVTGTEAAKMVLTALGYNSEIFKFTGVDWALNVNSWANGPDAQLYNELKNIDPSAAISRENAAQMLFNALDAKIVETTYRITSNGTETGYVISDSKTMMTEKFNADKYEGVVIANEVADLTATGTASSLKEGKTQIEWTAKNGVDFSGTAGTNKITVNTSTGVDTLGRTVSVYVSKNSARNDNNIIGNLVIDPINYAVSFTTSKAIDDIAKDNDLKIIAAGGTNPTKYHKNYGVAETSAITNGVAGQVTMLVDNDGDNEVEYVFQVASKLEQVTKIDTKNKRTTFDITGNKDNKDLVGETDLEKDDYVLTTAIAGKLYIELPETITGTASGYKRGTVAAGTANKTVSLTVNGTNYDVADAVANTNLSKTLTAASSYTNLKKEATFYLNSVGNIVGVGSVAADEAANYAISWGGASGNVLDDNRVKLTLQDGTEGVYTISSDSDLKFATGSDGTAFDSIKDGSGNVVANNAIGRLVAYTIDKNGKVELSDPAISAAKSSTVTFDSGKAVVTVDSRNLALSRSTVFFYVKMNTAGNRVSKVEIYNGYNEATSISDADAATVALKNDVAEAVAFTGVTGASSSNTITKHLFLVNMGYTTDDGVSAEVYLAGSDQLETVTLDKNYTAGQLYLFSIDSDGVYSLKNDTTLTGDSAYKTGTVARISDSTVVVTSGTAGAEEVWTLTDETLVIDAWDENNVDSDGDPDPKAQDGVAVLGGTINRWDSVKMIVDTESKEIVTIVTDGDTTSTNVFAVTFATGKDTIDADEGSNGAYTLTVKDNAEEISKGDDLVLVIRCEGIDAANKSEEVTVADGSTATVPAAVTFTGAGEAEVTIKNVQAAIEIDTFTVTGTPKD